MFELKRISHEAIERSLERAMRYRLLNEPEEAESICLDILAIAPNHQQAITTMLLALTDQFPENCSTCVQRARDLLPSFESEYDRAYYAGIISERRANARLLGHTRRSESMAYDLFRDAMDHYEHAERFSPPGNEDALLRWNTCARAIVKHKLAGRDELREPLMLE
jgi:hypothetical protein